ncbi:hypothetical protein [Pontibacter roseus]|uniref:hypothetical protein n=1 Tax=Pontibacter roseus TaxID=336989 RepID=UPI00037BAF1C|nr:hypothetical protein [Pontibacter roseus]
MQLNKEETKFIQKWESTSSRGRWHYILVRGLLWGMLVSGLSHLFKVWDDLKAWDASTLTDSYASSAFLVRLIIFSALGFGLFAFEWYSKTERYNKLKKIERRSQAADMPD